VRIGYPCQNLSIGCTSARTFRLASYSAERLIETVALNLECLKRILEYNLENGFLFFRVTSDLVPFASHPICRVRWQKRFAGEFAGIGKFIRKHRMRVSMHPDQFTLINSHKVDIFKRSVRELVYHAEVLDLMGLSRDAKIQIHVGGVYGDKPASMCRFVERYANLPGEVRRRLVIENDDISYTLEDCLKIHRELAIPVLFDVFHHSLNSSGESAAEAIRKAARTWKRLDGILMVDYSSQKRGARKGSHTQSIDLNGFRKFLSETKPCDFDLMLEIKDKERSAKRALAAASSDRRLVTLR
jgi:UV DNA damage endonuclease